LQMEITKTQQQIPNELAARINPASFEYRIPGIQTWAILFIYLVLIIFSPRTALTLSQIVSVYLLLRFTLIAFFYLISLVKIRQEQRRVRTTSVTDGLTPDQVDRFKKIHHIVIFPNFKEPSEVLARSIQAIANQTIDHSQITVVLAMEEIEVGGRVKARQLAHRFGSSFANFLVTYHPPRIPGEIPGKAANQTWGARQVKRDIVDRLGIPLENVTVTSCDADSELDPNYFSVLTREFVTCEKPENLIWQSPIFFDHNIWHTPGSVRLLTFFNNAVQVSELSNPAAMAFPLSTYSLSFKLAVEVDYWDPLVISDDWHMFLRCYFAKDGDMHLRSIFLPTTGEPFLGESIIKTWMMVYKTRVRHAWGALDMVYVLQQWQRNGHTPFLSKLGRLVKIWHDNTIFGLGGVFTVVGTLLSIVIDHNPVITYPPFPVPYVMPVLNVLGGLGLIMIWIVERIRCNNARISWKPQVLLGEIASWIIFPVITFVLSGVPSLHAHTKILLGDSMTFERTPKGILPKNKW
jgi:hypothetical protein